MTIKNNPGQLCNQPQKTMRVNINPFIKSCGTRTVPATETESIGLAADLSNNLSFLLITMRLVILRKTLVFVS